MSKNATSNKGLETRFFEGIITGTSDKQSKDFDNKEMRKSVYFTPANAEVEKEMLDFGLRQYESKNKEKFFILKTSENIKIGVTSISGVVKEVQDGVYSGVSKNFTSNEENVLIAVLKGKSKGNVYYRIYGIKGLIVPNETDVFADAETDIKDVEIDINAFSKNVESENNTVDISADDLPF